MDIYSLLPQTLFNYTYFFSWRDAVEILFFSSIVYYLSLWLKKDKQKNLLGYFYGYCFIAVIAHVIQLTTISTSLFLCTPVIIALFAIIHQETLQRNFILLKNITPKQHQVDWLEELLRSCLHALNNNKNIICIIEHKDNLNDSIITSLPVNAALQKDLLDMLIESSSFDQTKMIWLNTQGKLLGINATWKMNTDETWITEEAKQLPRWKSDALLITAKTDAFVLHGSFTTHTFDIIIQGKTFENISAHHAIKMLKKYIYKQNTQNKKGEIYYGSKHQRDSIQQHNP